jgi:hypothetical protein
MAATLQQFLARAATRQRVVVLGGLAVIAHGYSRPTKDGDAWLEPLGSLGEWAEALRETLSAFEGLTLWSLAERRVMGGTEIEETIRLDGVLRVHGLTADLDLFRKPNGLEVQDFDSVWQQATSWADEVRVMDPIDLILTKQDTGRDQDVQDVSYLELTVRRDLGARLAVATPQEAAKIFARYVDHVVCERALANPHAEVRAQARALLTELAASGDWFARDVLAKGEG